MSVPALTIGVPARATEEDLPGALASLDASAERAGEPCEIVVAVNGPEEPAPAVAGARAFATARAMPLVAADAEPPPRLPCLRLLRLGVASKVAAWNAIRAVARAEMLVFADADVRVGPDAIGLLLARLHAEPGLVAAAGREVAVLEPGDGLAARVAALPHRFDFGNVPGRLYALRASAFAEAIPASVLHEDAYLTVRLGRARFAKEAGAVVFLRPPTTWREYLRQRVRNELGKLQLVRDFPELYAAHGFGRYPWRHFVRAIALREYPLVVLALAARAYARCRARREAAAGVPTGWAVLPSTKRWVPAVREPAAPASPESGHTTEEPATGP